MLNNMIKESTDPRVQELKKEIEAIKKQRGELVSRMRESQYRLNYKNAEQQALVKLVEMQKAKEQGKAKENIGKLKRMRHSIEFRISTESMNLQQEKSMVRKIEEVNALIEEALKLERLERKRGLVSKDIEMYQKTLGEVVAKITELDAKLDTLYSEIRKSLGIQKRRPKVMGEKRPQPKPQKNEEINLEDIVVIKKKGGASAN